MKSTYEKPSERKKRITEENIKRVKKLQKLKNRIQLNSKLKGFICRQVRLNGLILKKTLKTNPLQTRQSITKMLRSDLKLTGVFY